MKKISKLLLKASFIGTFAETMLIPVWAVLTDKVGGSIVDAGIGFGLFSIITGVVVIIVGKLKWYQEHLNYMVFWGFLICGIGDVLYIGVTNKWQLFFVQSLIGLSAGILAPAWDGLYTEDIKVGEGAEKWSFWTGGISFITGTSAILGTLILHTFGWNTLFITMGLVDVLAIYYAYEVILCK